MKFVLASILVLCCSMTASAQSDEVRNIFFDTMRAGDVQPTPIGVENPRHIGTTQLGGEEYTILSELAQVVRWDINFYADFDLVEVDTFFLKTYEITELDFLGWMRLGARYVARLEVEFPGPNVRVYWRLFDTQTQNQFARGQIEENRQFVREIAHNIANEIVYTLTGDPGIFRTQIVYVRKLGKAKELFVCDYDGYNERQLTRNGSLNISPTFHPIREEVFFTSYAGGKPDLYKADIQTGKISKVASYPGIVAAPAVSPQGDRIACVLSKDGNSEIYLLSLNGEIIRRLTNHSAIESSPSWSPDGSRIAFTSDRTGTPQIYVMNADGSDVTRLTYEGGYNDSPLWSKRGERVTFVSRTKQGRFDLASIRTDGTDYRVLTQIGMNENPHFAPDGKHIVFASTRLSGGDIFTMDVTGRNQRRLTRVGNASNPTWGPIR